MNTPNLEQLAAMVTATKNTLDYDQEQLDEARREFDELIAAHAGDDELADTSECITQREAVLKISEARYRGALADQVKGEADAKLAQGMAAKARADALLADVQQRINTAMQNAAAELVAAADDCSKMMEECNEARRIANINGVQYWKPGEQINVPNRDAVADSVRRLGGLRLWRLY